MDLYKPSRFLHFKAKNPEKISGFFDRHLLRTENMARFERKDGSRHQTYFENVST